MNELLTFEQFCENFADEQACILALYNARWPNGFRCPRCSHAYFYTIGSRKLPLYECTSCHAQTSLISGTILEGTRTPLRLWFQALYLHASPRGISATQLCSIIGTTYKTAWLICHKIRHAMSASDTMELLSGIVKVNSVVYGRPYNPTIFRHPQEQPLLAGVSIGLDNQILQLKIKQVPDEHLVYDRIVPSGGHSFVERHVDPSREKLSIVILKYSPHRHRDIIQLGKHASNWINNTFNGIGYKHLQSYLDQFCFGFNQARRNIDMFANLLRLCANTPTLKYPNLISRRNQSSQHKRIYSDQLKNAC